MNTEWWKMVAIKLVNQLSLGRLEDFLGSWVLEDKIGVEFLYIFSLWILSSASVDIPVGGKVVFQGAFLEVHNGFRGFPKGSVQAIICLDDGVKLRAGFAVHDETPAKPGAECEDCGAGVESELFEVGWNEGDFSVALSEGKITMARTARVLRE